MAQDKTIPLGGGGSMTLESDIGEITKSLGRTERPKAQGPADPPLPRRFEAEMPARLKSRTIIERIQHIRNEICELDLELAGIRSDLADKIGLSER